MFIARRLFFMYCVIVYVINVKLIIIDQSIYYYVITLTVYNI